MQSIFDMEKNPWQMNNLANSPSNAKVFIELKKQLNNELKATDDPHIKGDDKICDQNPSMLAGVLNIRSKKTISKR